MRIDNEFTVDAPVERVWDLLTDVEAIAPCMPGARLTGVESGPDGDVYSGTVRVKVGPVAAAYEGTAWFVGQDARNRRAVIEAKGRAGRGGGNASASVTLELREEGGGTAVSVGTDLRITGKLAQLGGGMVKDVSERLLGQFVECLEGKLTGTETEAAVMAHHGAEFGGGAGDDANGRSEEGRGSHTSGGDHMSGGGHMSGGAHMSGGRHMSADGDLSDEVQESGDGAGPEGTWTTATGLTPGSDPAPTGPAPSTRRSIDGGEAAPLDLGRATGKAVVQRLWPMLAVVVVVVGLLLGYAYFT
ncbi:SRPBCC family protein [Nocardiopsis ganjiahuensis]|uniref:SRPBCC family protein n=1 Tax=Nocardiopsis ganjiahuensis TaxID=239984 RepID=UPI0003497725|nr:SRPBCC family protein [Nocardiopsis ganjiahuensis]